MPPQKNLRKLLSQAQKKQGKNETTLPPELKPKPKKPPSSYKVSKQTEEELAYQEFLAQLDFSKDPDQVRLMIDEFANATAGKFQGRKLLLQNIFNTLPPHLWFTFVQEFIGQKDKSLSDFFDTYILRPNVQEDIKQLQLAKIAEEVAEEIDEEELAETIYVTETTVAKKPKRPIKLYDPITDQEITEFTKPTKPKPPTPQSQELTYLQKQCIQELKKAPWLDSVVKKVYIAPVPGGNSIELYKADQPSISRFNIKWYPANLKFFLLLCTNKSNQTQNKNIFTTEIIKQGVTSRISFRIGYDTSSGFLIQNENICCN